MTIPSSIATGGHATDAELVDAQLAVIELLGAFSSGVLKAANGGTGTATSPLPIANGGTGSATQNFVDLTTGQAIAGQKVFTNSNTYFGVGSGGTSSVRVREGAAGNNAEIDFENSGGATKWVLGRDTIDGFFIYDNVAGHSIISCAINGACQILQLQNTRVVLTYSATIATDASLGNIFSITANNGTAFTISNPTNLVTGQRVLYTIRNTSGGALGAITWGGTFKMAAWVSPATANSRSTEFVYDGTNLVQLWQSAADVPN